MAELTFSDYPSPELMKSRAAWQAHYMLKGCSHEKAWWLAYKKNGTWPPDIDCNTQSNFWRIAARPV